MHWLVEKKKKKRAANRPLSTNTKTKLDLI